MMEWLHRQSHSISSAALMLGAASFMARLLGVLRDRILAGMYGAGPTLDAYYVAFRIPDMLYNFVILGTLSAAFIPLFASERTRDKHWAFANNILTIIATFLVVASGALWLCAPLLMHILAPGFTLAQHDLAVAMTRVLFLSPLLLGLSGIFNAMLQAHQRFVASALSPLLYNLGIIAGALFLVPLIGPWGLAWGVVLGAFLHMAVQIPSIVALGFIFQPSFRIRDATLRHMLTLSVPRIISLGVAQVELVIATIITSGLIAGSMSVFQFGYNIQSFPLGIIGISFATAAFPTLAGHMSNGHGKDFLHSFTSTLRQVVFFMAPAASLLLLLRAQIVRVLLGGPHFDWADTIATTEVLTWFAFSLVAQALIPLFTRAFYARKSTTIPLIAGMGGVATSVSLSLLLAPRWGVGGLACAFSVAQLVNFSLLFILFEARNPSFMGKREFMLLFSTMGSLMAMAGVIQVMKYIVAGFVNMQTWLGIFTQGAVAGTMGLAVYALCALLLRVPEAAKLYTTLKSYWPYGTHS